MNNIEVRYLGVEGSYSHEIALRFINKEQLESYDLNSYKSITNIVTNDITYKNTLAILPLENTTSGDVYETYFQLYKEGFNIISSMQLEINHVLITHEKTNINNIKEVYSHPQALIQVSQYLDNHKMIGIPEFSTADAVRIVAKSNDSIGAIASQFVLKYYDNLKIIDDKVNNGASNFTRFIITKLDNNIESYQVNLNHTNDSAYLFLLFELNKDKTGELTNVLDLLSKHNINLFSIKSRPTQTNAFEYFFVVESIIEDINHQQVVDELRQVTKGFVYNTYNK